MVNNKIIPQIETDIQTAMTTFNADVLNENANTFLFNLLGNENYLFNLT